MPQNDEQSEIITGKIGNEDLRSLEHVVAEHKIPDQRGDPALAMITAKLKQPMR